MPIGRTSVSPAIRGRDDEAVRVMGLVHESRQAMQEQHESWLYDIQFFRGFQWIYQNNSLGRLLPIPVTPWRPRITDNQTRPLVTQMLALLIEKDPTYKATAASRDEDDLLAAAGFEALLRRDWERFDASEKLEDVLLSMLITGNGFWRVAWNPLAGRPLGVPSPDGGGFMVGRGDPKAEKRPSGAPAAEATVLPFRVPGEEGQEPPAPTAVRFTGDVEIQVVSPFNIDVPIGATSLEHASWVAQHAFVHRDVLVDRIGSRAKNLVAGESVGLYTNYERQLRFDHGAWDLAVSETGDLIRVTEFWEAPTKAHPTGRVITVAGGETLTVKDSPYGGRHPFVHFTCNPAPGRFWADGIVRELEPLQKALNSALSRYALIMMLSANPKVVADKDSGIKDAAINDEPGEVIFKRRGSSVEFVNPPVPATIHPAVMSFVTNSMQTLTGVNDVLAGQNAPNVRAALSIRFLQESGLRRFVPIARRVEGALRRTGRMLLYLHQRFWSDDRIERVLGGEGAAEMFYMRRADVERVSDVSIQAGSLIPKSPAAQQEIVISLLQYAPFLFQGQGSIGREDLLRILDMPSMSGTTGIKQAQRQRAYGEHRTLLEGGPVEVLPWDDDDLHMEIHGCRLSDERWSRDNPQAAAMLAEHYAAHEVNKMQKLSGLMLGAPGAAPTTGATGEPGTAPRPPGGAAGRGGPPPGPAVPSGAPRPGASAMAGPT